MTLEPTKPLATLCRAEGLVRRVLEWRAIDATARQELTEAADAMKEVRNMLCELCEMVAANGNR